MNVSDPNSRRVNIAIVIVNYETSAFVRRCVETLAWQDVPKSIVVADNPSPKEDWKNLPDGSIKILRLSENIGYGRACNAAAEAVPDATHVCVLNPDTALPPGSLQLWLDAYEALRASGGRTGPMCVAPRLWNDNGTTQLSRYRFVTFWSYWIHHSVFSGLCKSYLKDSMGQKRYQDEALATVERVRNTDPRVGPQPVAQAEQVDWVMGSAMLFDRSSWDQLQGFSPKFFMYSEDADICWRAWKSGGSVHYLPGVAIYHTQGEPTPEDRGRRLVMLYRGFLTFLRHNYGNAHRFMILMAITLDMTIRIPVLSVLRVLRPGDVLNRSRLAGCIEVMKLIAGKRPC